MLSLIPTHRPCSVSMFINLYVFVRVSVTMSKYIRMSSLDDEGFETALLVEQSREILGRLRWYPLIYTMVRPSEAPAGNARLYLRPAPCATRGVCRSCVVCVVLAALVPFTYRVTNPGPHPPPHCSCAYPRP